MPDRRTGEDNTEGRAFVDYGTAGFGVGEVLGREAAKRQEEILTGAKYSANQAPPGYRPGFDPEYLYFGDPRYEDYAALLPGIYGAGYNATNPNAAGAPAPLGSSPAGGVTGSMGVPAANTAQAASAGVSSPVLSTEDILRNLPRKGNDFTQDDIKNAMGLIAAGEYDIYSLADALEIDRSSAMSAYNKYLKDTYGVGTFNPNVDTLSPESIQQYYGVANQQAYSPEQLSRIFGIPLDQSRSFLTQQYFSGIDVDNDYSNDEAQAVYDLYSSGRMGAVGISNYFGIPLTDVERILGEIGDAGGSVANVGATTPAATTDTTSTVSSDSGDSSTADTTTTTVSSPLAGIDVDGDYSQSEANQVYDMFVSGQVTPLDISTYFNLPLDEVNTALSDIAQSRMPPTNVATGSTTVNPQDVRSSDRASGAVSPMRGEDTEGGEGFTPLDLAFDLYQSGTELSTEEIREALSYAQANGVSYAEIDRMFGAPAGSAQDAAAALGMAASAGGIVGMAEGKSLSASHRRSPDKPYVFPYGVTGMEESLDLVDRITDMQDSLSNAKDPEKKKMLETELEMLIIHGANVNAVPFENFSNFVEVQQLKNITRDSQKDELEKGVMSGLKSLGLAEGGKFPDLSGDGEVTQEDILIGRGVIEKADGGILGLMKKEQKETPKGALLTETESYLEAQKILSNPDSSDRDKAFAKGTLETLKPQEQGGNMDMNAFAEMMQQLDKIQGATKGMQEGGFIGREQLDSLIQMTRDAILGDAENADEIIREFVSVFGNEAFQQLRDQVLQTQVPDAQTEGMIEGQGGGMDDEVMGMIGNQQPVAVSPGEYIIPADVVASLGDGSSDAGADKLDTMLDDVRMAKTGRTIQPGKIDDRVIPA